MVLGVLALVLAGAIAVVGGSILAGLGYEPNGIGLDDSFGWRTPPEVGARGGAIVGLGLLAIYCGRVRMGVEELISGLFMFCLCGGAVGFFSGAIGSSLVMLVTGLPFEALGNSRGRAATALAVGFGAVPFLLAAIWAVAQFVTAVRLRRHPAEVTRSPANGNGPERTSGHE